MYRLLNLALNHLVLCISVVADKLCEQEILVDSLLYTAPRLPFSHAAKVLGVPNSAENSARTARDVAGA